MTRGGWENNNGGGRGSPDRSHLRRASLEKGMDVDSDEVLRSKRSGQQPAVSPIGSASKKATKHQLPGPAGGPHAVD
jgi:hypothetical protein